MVTHRLSYLKFSYFNIFRVGLDLYKDKVVINKKAGVLELAILKIKLLKLVTKAAITILRVHDMIRLDPKRIDG